MARPLVPPLTPEEREDAERRGALARELAEEALSRFRGYLTPEGYEILRDELMLQLLTSPEGEAMLARVLPAPAVEESAEIERGAGNAELRSVSSANSKKLAGGAD